MVWKRSWRWECGSAPVRWCPGWARPSRSDLQGHRGVKLLPVKILFPGVDSGAKTHPAPSGPWALPEVCVRFAQTPDTGRAAGEQPDILRTDRLFMMTTKVRQNSFTALREHWNENSSYFHVFFHLFYVTHHRWDHHEREFSRNMVNCRIVKLWACSFGNRRILWIQPEVVLQEFPDARAKNKKNAHEISLKNSVNVSPAPSFVSLQEQKRGEFFVRSDAAKVWNYKRQNYESAINDLLGWLGFRKWAHFGWFKQLQRIDWGVICGFKV